jgi:streptothricin hydrolase
MSEPVDVIVVVDPQVGILSGDDAVPEADEAVAVLRELLDRARSAGVPVIYLQNDGDEGSAGAGGGVFAHSIRGKCDA